MLINPMDIQYQQERLQDMLREAEKHYALRQCLSTEEGHEKSVGLIRHWIHGWGKRLSQNVQEPPQQTSPILR